MINSGAFQLIKNLELKEAIINLYSEYDEKRALFSGNGNWMVNIVSHVDMQTDLTKFSPDHLDIPIYSTYINSLNIITMKNTKLKKYKRYLILLAFVFLAIGLNAQSNGGSETETSIATTINNEDLKWLPAPDFFPDCSFTILHGDISKPNLDFFFKIEPNTEVVNHTHNSPERMILISGDLEVQYQGEKPVVLKAGSYAYGPAGKPHKAKCLDNGPCVLFVAMVDPFDAVPITKKE